MCKILITGAGVDKTTGIDFPLANKLLPEIARFIKHEGADFEKALRQAIPGLRFDFNRFINGEIESITRKDDGQLRAIVEIVNKAVNSIDDKGSIVRKRGEVIVRLFDKLVAIQESSQIDDETFALIKEAFGNDFTESDFVIDIHKVSLSDTFKSILKLTLRESLTDDSNPISDAIASYLLDIEQLLIQKFLGFYNQHLSDVKNYIYISWCLWGYLVIKQRQVNSDLDGKPLPFYSKLPDDIKGITLNYTTFLSDFIGSDVIYFHGGLAEYVRMDTRQLIPIHDLSTLNLKEFVVEQISPNIDFSNENIEKHKHVIPSLVPPLKLKPILSHKYIDTWARAAELIHRAEKVVVIGYSFNNADEHFNDIIRNGEIRKYDIVAPDAHTEQFMSRIEKVFGLSLDNFTVTRVQGYPAKTTTRLRLIAAKADDINVQQLFD